MQGIEKLNFTLNLTLLSMQKYFSDEVQKKLRAPLAYKLGDSHILMEEVEGQGKSFIHTQNEDDPMKFTIDLRVKTENSWLSVKIHDIEPLKNKNRLYLHWFQHSSSSCSSSPEELLSVQVEKEGENFP